MFRCRTFWSPMQVEIRREGKPGSDSEPVPDGHPLKGRFADIDQHRLVGDGSAGGRGPGFCTDGDRSSRYGRGRARFHTAAQQQSLSAAGSATRHSERRAKVGHSDTQLFAPVERFRDVPGRGVPAYSTMSALLLSMKPSTSARSAAGTLNASSVASRWSRKTCQSPSSIRMPLCEVFMSRPT
jgi:hypothetical protein